MKTPGLSRVELLILSSLSAREEYGLAIVERVKELTDGSVTLPLGGLYTTLHRMERKGLVRGRWGESNHTRKGARRRYYRVTGLGERALSESTRLLRKALRPAIEGVYR
jgi:DNA-binding PadR family transcriptional regulator